MRESPSRMPTFQAIDALIQGKIRAFGLDLTGLSILTEAATGNYAYGPIIAALAGAERVYVYCKDSRYGTQAEVYANLHAMAERFGISDRLVYSREKSEHAGLADIVTNTGHLRPLDGVFIQKLRPEAVIPLMWETWEWRPTELDLDACRQHGVMVLGTHEGHKDIRLHLCAGLIPVKMLFDMGFAIFDTRVLLVGGCPVGDFIEDVFKRLSLPYTRILPFTRDEELGSLLESHDVLLVADHREKRQLVGGEDAFIPLTLLRRHNPHLPLAHICGDIDADLLRSSGFCLFPERIAPVGYMSWSGDALGASPTFTLLTAGMKVGEVMARSRKENTAPEAAMAAALRHPYCMPFPEDAP